jgi:hypothetical protein
MLAVLVAALVAAAGNPDVVVTTDGTRIRGMVVEESAAGVTIQVDDGTIRRFERGQVQRIEFSDGSISTWPAPPPPAPPPAPAPVQAQVAPAPAPPPAAPAPQAAPPPSLSGPFDTVFFLGGGRVRGTVLEESPTSGVTIRLLDGTLRKYSRDEIVRIEYADGSVSRRRQAPPPAPRPPVAPAPQAAPPPALPPQPPAYQAQKSQAPILPVYGAIGLGATMFSGKSFEGVEMDDEFNPQAHLSLEGGLRLSPAFAIGVYMDGGAGDPSRSVREACDAVNATCTGVTGRFGFLLRHTWDYAAPTSKWLSLGTGWEVASVTRDDTTDTEVFTYTGREYIRLGGGIDFRSNAVLGVGLYGSVSWGEYDDIEDRRVGAPQNLPGATHITTQVGLRLTLFP